MILTDLSVSNFKNFSDKQIAFSTGINILLGPNGSGKTSLLEAIEFSLYGSVTGRVGLEPLVRLGEKVATVTLGFIVEREGKAEKFSIVRQISRGETGASTTLNSLTKDGTEVSSKKSVVDREVLRILGLSHPTYLNTCYIRQGEIRALLEAGKDREREVDRIMGFGVFEEAWRDLRKREAELERATTKAKEELIRAQTDMQSLRSVSDELSRKMEEKVKIEGEIRELEQRLGSEPAPPGPTMPAAGREEVESAQTAEALQERLTHLSRDIEALNDTILDQDSAIRRAENKIASLTEERKDLEQRLLRAEEDVRKAEQVTSQVREEVMRTEADLETKRIYVTSFAQMEARGELACPLCGSELTPDHSREVRRLLDSQIAELQETVARKRADLDRFEQALEASRSREAKLRSQLLEVEQQIAKAEMERDMAVSSKEEAERRLGLLLQEKRETEISLERQKELGRQVYKPATQATEASPLAELRAQYLADKRILEQLQQEIPKLIQALGEEQLKKERFAEAKDRYQRAEKELEKIRDLRWVFNNIGPYARREVLGQVAQRTRDLFAGMYGGSNIAGIELTPDYDIQARMPDGSILPSRSLSVGEKVVAGLALRIALAEVGLEARRGASGQLSRPGFLILDEPTEYLDEANLRSLGRTLAGLQSVKQVIIVTHDAELVEEIAAQTTVNKILLPGTEATPAPGP